MSRDSIRTGLSFGLTSGIITTLGLLVGLGTGTSSQPVVIGGILTIAIADSLSDALGIHVSEESQAEHTAREIWQSTGAAFLAKLIFASTFIVPVALLDISPAIVVSIIYGLALIAVTSFFVAREEKANPFPVITEHLLVAAVVVVATYLVGLWISRTFN